MTCVVLISLFFILTSSPTPLIRHPAQVAGSVMEKTVDPSICKINAQLFTDPGSSPEMTKAVGMTSG